MSKSVRIALATIVILIIGCGLVYSGIVIGRSAWIPHYGSINSQGMRMPFMGSSEYCAHSNNFGNHMMSGHRMMGEYYFNSGDDIQPLPIDEVDLIIHEYLENNSAEDLILGEIMVFDNHAYAQIIEKSTGIGAMEILIDPQTRSVYPEQGPNMMWNLKYSPMGSSDRFQGPGMMSGSSRDGFEESNITSDEAENMPVSSDQAVGAAQKYLDQYHPGTTAEEHVDRFYGYYTIHVLRADDVIGMLSVNGYNSQVFFHNWHGEFIQMSDH